MNPKEATIGQKTIAFIFICASVIISMGLPSVGHIATLYIVLYALVLSLNIKIWPILLLTSVPLLNLATYSGHFAVNEFDSLILVTFGIIWFKQKKSPAPTTIEFKIFLVLIGFSLISGLNAISTFPPPEELYLTVYQQPINIWRVGKSLVYALLLYLLIHTSDRRETGEILRNFSIGAFASIFVLTLIILWEKNVLTLLFTGAPLREILGSILYFSIDFRPTTLFSTMHTGGGSLDSYIAIMFIFPIILLFSKPSRTSKIFFLIALLTGLYCALATVSRTVIAATALTTVIITVFQIVKASRTSIPTHQSNLANLFSLLALLILWVSSLIIVQPPMGTEGVLALPLFTFVISIAIYRFKTGRTYLLGIVLVLCSLLIAEALFDRIEKGTSLEDVFYKGVILIGLIALNTAAFTFKFKNLNQLKPFALPLFIFIISATFMSLGFSSASLANRLSEIIKDTEGREHHWNTVRNTGSTSPLTQFIGNGPGSMPLNYHLAFTGSDYFTVKQLNPIEGTLSVLGSAQALIQRVEVQKKETYTLHTSLRSEDIKGHITIAICNRNIIIQTTHNPTCFPMRLTLTKKGQWQDFSIPLSTEAIKNQGIFHSQTNLEIKFYRFTEPVEIQHIGLINSKGTQVLLNPGFEQGLDSWFWASDFQHLGWHSKNAFLHLYFELGGIGLFLILAILFSIIIKTMVKRNQLDLTIQISVYSLILNFILLGSFITLLDDPQIATFWYLSFLIYPLLISNPKILIPSITPPSPKTLNTLIIKNKNVYLSIWKQKNKSIIISIIFLLFISISIDFYTRFTYNASPTQMVARFSSSRVNGLKAEHPYLNFIWNFISSVAPQDERFK